MALANLAIKRHNHRVYFTDPERKSELISVIAEAHPGISIAVVTTEALELSEPISVVTEVTSDFDMIISYELPEDSEGYLKRLAFAKQFAFVLLGPDEQAKLYPLENVLGRSLVQEWPKGFVAQAVETKAAPKPEKAKIPPRKKHFDGKPKGGKPPFKGKKPFQKSAKPQAPKRAPKTVKLKAPKDQKEA